jgi:hypothetical protein
MSLQQVITLKFRNGVSFLVIHAGRSPRRFRTLAEAFLVLWKAKIITLLCWKRKFLDESGMIIWAARAEMLWTLSWRWRSKWERDWAGMAAGRFPFIRMWCEGIPRWLVSVQGKGGDSVLSPFHNSRTSKIDLASLIFTRSNLPRKFVVTKIQIVKN